MRVCVFTDVLLTVRKTPYEIIFEKCQIQCRILREQPFQTHLINRYFGRGTSMICHYTALPSVHTGSFFALHQYFK